jgi:hypothetical protein
MLRRWAFSTSIDDDYRDFRAGSVFFVFYAAMANIPMWAAIPLLNLERHGAFCLEYAAVGVIGLLVPESDETLTYYAMPAEHWRCLRTNNPLERLMREIRRRTRVVGAFPDGNSALMLVAARLRHVAATKWGTKRYLQMNRLA